MLNYYFVQFQEKDNKDIHGYKLLLDNKELEILLYDIDKISHKDLIQKKKEFFNFLYATNTKMLIDVRYY